MVSPELVPQVSNGEILNDLLYVLNFLIAVTQLVIEDVPRGIEIAKAASTNLCCAPLLLTMLAATAHVSTKIYRRTLSEEKK